MVEIPGLFFIKFNCINVFKFKIEIKSFNQYLSLENINNISEQFDFPKKIKFKHIIKSYYKNFESLMLKYIEYLKKISIKTDLIKTDLINKELDFNLESKLVDFDNIKNIDNITNLDNINNIDNLSNFNIDDKNNPIIEFNIPILWNECVKLFKKIKEQNVNKKILLEHWNNCEECEKINNNLCGLELKNKKIVIKNIKSIENYHIIDQIILDYQNIRKFAHTKFNSDFNFEDDKINLIYCFESNNIYKNCLFILNK
jgi:hypothetical protein